MARGKAAHNRKKGVKRQPDGRPSQNKTDRKKWQDSQREMTEAEALSVVTWQREKLGVDPKHSRDQKAGTVHGKLNLQGALDENQYEAAEWFLKIRNRYQLSIQSPGGVFDRPEGYVPSGDPDAHTDYCDKIKSQWQDINDAVCDAVFQTGNRQITNAIDAILVRQEEEYALVGDLRIVLNYLHRLRSGQGKRAA